MTFRILRWLGIAVLAIGYPLLAHYTSKSAHDSNLGALVAIAPVAVFAFILAWRSNQRIVLLGALAVAGAALWAGWSTLEHHFGLVYWLQYMAVQLLLFMTFARTLVGGRQPLCTRLAEAVHAPLTPEHEIYARQVTIAWTLFFAGMGLVSTLLLFLTPLSTWSVFANFLTLPLVAVMFIAEYWVRRWMLPDTRNTRILDAVRAFWKTSARPR